VRTYVKCGFFSFQGTIIQYSLLDRTDDFEISHKYVLRFFYTICTLSIKCIQYCEIDRISFFKQHAYLNSLNIKITI